MVAVTCAKKVPKSLKLEVVKVAMDVYIKAHGCMDKNHNSDKCQHTFRTYEKIKTEQCQK